MDQKQVASIEARLRDAGNGDWKVCFFHHALYSSARYRGPAADLRETLEPLFVKYGVNILFAGHNHVYERVLPQHGIYYFTAGASGSLRAGNLSPSAITAKGFDTDRSSLLLEFAGDDSTSRPRRAQGVAVDFSVIHRAAAEDAVSAAPRISNPAWSLLPTDMRGSTPSRNWRWTCAGRGTTRPTECGSSWTQGCGTSRTIPGASCRPCRATGSSACCVTPVCGRRSMNSCRPSAAAPRRRHGSSDVSVIAADLGGLLQHGVHVERSPADLLGRAWQRGGRPAQGRQRSRSAGGRRGAPVPAGILPPGDRQGRGPAGALSLQRSGTAAHHGRAPPERRVAAAGDCPARLLGLVACLAGSGRPGEALPPGQQRRGQRAVAPRHHE